jgi:ribosomal protein S18 acetylase RimI-like enzyme
MQTPSSSKIRLAAPEDGRVLADLMREFYAESNYSISHDRAEKSFLNLLTNQDRGCVWLATRDGHAVGYVVLTLRYAMDHGALDGHVDDLFVRSTHRRQRIGFDLLSALLDECRSRSCGAVHVEVGHDNVPAVALYRSFGLEESHDGRVFLQRRLGAPGARQVAAAGREP